MTEELKAKLALQEQDRNKKIKALNTLGTKALINMLPQLEEKLEAALRQEASFRDLNHGYLSTGTYDCAEAKRIIAELTLQGPSSEEKMTAAERDAWLVKQRTDNLDLNNALTRQKDVSFQLEGLRVDIEMAKKRLESILKIISLRTAQIQFLTDH